MIILPINKSKSYVLPLIEGDVDLDYTLVKHIVNTYLYCYLYDIRLSNVLTLEFNGSFTKRTDFDLYKNKLESSGLFIYHGIHKDFWYCILNLPKRFSEDVKLFQEGKYSIMSDAAKNQIWRHLKKYYPHRKEKCKLIWKILKKDVTLKLELERRLSTILPESAELCDKIKESDETIVLE